MHQTGAMCLFSRTFFLILAGLISLPVLVVSVSWFLPIGDIWQHFVDTLLLELFINTLILLIGVGIGVSVLGATLAWLVVMVEFPLRRYLEWALLLPFAIPAYVLGFVYLGVFDYSSPLQSYLRDNLGIDGVDIRKGYFGIIFTFVLVFYPYVYIMCRASFKRQQANILASARLLGASMWRVFWSMSLPLARPAIVAGVIVTMMETLADFGVVSLFNYDTLTTAIYSAWIDFRSIAVAAQLASILVLVASILLYLEGLGRKGIRYDTTEVTKHRPYVLTGYKSYMVTGLVIGVLLLSFVVPLLQLLFWSYQVFDGQWFVQNSEIISSSLLLSLLAMVIIIVIAIILALPNDCLKNHIVSRISVRLATLGYAVPGSVMAVGLLYGIDSVSNITEVWFDINLTQYLFGGIALLIFAYTSRFMAIAYHSISAASEQVKQSLVQSARLLGMSHFKTIIKIQIPLMLPGIVGACLLVSIDVLKELPATYLLRPFNWDTLAVRIYELSSEGFYEQAAIPALIMVVLATLLVVFFQRFDKRLSNS